MVAPLRRFLPVVFTAAWQANAPALNYVAKLPRFQKRLNAIACKIDMALCHQTRP